MTNKIWWTPASVHRGWINLQISNKMREKSEYLLPIGLPLFGEKRRLSTRFRFRKELIITGITNNRCRCRLSIKFMLNKAHILIFLYTSGVIIVDIFTRGLKDTPMIIYILCMLRIRSPCPVLWWVRSVLSLFNYLISSLRFIRSVSVVH